MRQMGSASDRRALGCSAPCFRWTGTSPSGSDGPQLETEMLLRQGGMAVSSES